MSADCASDTRSEAGNECFRFWHIVQCMLSVVKRASETSYFISGAMKYIKDKLKVNMEETGVSLSATAL